MRRDLVGGRLALVRGVGPEHRGAHRHVTDERREVAQHRELIEHAEVVGLSSAGEAHAVVDRGPGDLLDGAQRVDDVVARGGVGDRRERVPAVAGDHGGHAERRRRRDVGIPEEVGVEVRVWVDEAGREHEAAAVELLASGARRVPHHRDPVTVDGDVGLEPGTAAPVEHRARPAPPGRAAPSSSGDGSRTAEVRRTLGGMQEHHYEIVLDATPEEVWEVFWYRGPDKPKPELVTIEILHPGNEIGEGLVRHCTFPVPKVLGSGGVGKSWEWVTQVKPYESWRYDAVGKPLWSRAVGPHQPRRPRRRAHARALHRDLRDVQSVDAADRAREVGPREDLERQRLLLQGDQRRPRVPPCRKAKAKAKASAAAD